MAMHWIGFRVTIQSFYVDMQNLKPTKNLIIFDTNKRQRLLLPHVDHFYVIGIFNLEW